MKIEKFKEYFEQMLEIMASECNVKQIVYNYESPAGWQQSIYSYDTIQGKSIGIDKEWPIFVFMFTGNVQEDMKKVREIVKSGLKQRMDSKIKVRQPLQSITISNNYKLKN